MTLTPYQPFYKRQLGTFDISFAIINTNPELVVALLQQVLVVEATAHYHKNSITYIGYHSQFLPLEEGVAPTEYQPIVHKAEDNSVTFTWQLKQ